MNTPAHKALATRWRTEALRLRATAGAFSAHDPWVEADALDRCAADLENLVPEQRSARRGAATRFEDDSSRKP